MSDRFEKLLTDQTRRISELENIKKKLSASENRYRQLFENSVVPIWDDDFSSILKELSGYLLRSTKP